MARPQQISHFLCVNSQSVLVDLALSSKSPIFSSGVSGFCSSVRLRLDLRTFFIKVTALSFKAAHTFSLQFVVGYLVINTLLFLLSLFTPLGITTNAFIVIGGGLMILFSKLEIAKDSHRRADYLPDFVCLLLSGIAATLWCTDALRPVVKEGPVTI